MQVSHLLATLVVLVLSLSLLSIPVRADPPTFCSPVTFDAFQVVAGSNSEGLMFAQINGTYPIQNYTYTLASTYLGTSVFFRINLTSNSTINTPGTIGLTFTLSLNGFFFNTSNGSPQVYTPNPTTGGADIEFFNWLVGRNTVDNVVQLNVSENIVVGGDVTTCSYIYVIHLINPGTSTMTGGFVTGDPQFVGLRGQSFQVHGVDGAVYNLISDKSMQLNSRFTFLEGPRPCPVMPSTGKRSTACWSHPGSYLSELALKTNGGSQLHIVAGDAVTGFASITLNGKALKAGSKGALVFDEESGLVGSVSMDNSHEVTIRAGHFDVVIENNDEFVNLRHVSVPSASWPKLASHGLLGQTWQNKRYGGKIKEIEGDVDDYLIEDDNLFGNSFLFNRFEQ